MKNAKLSLFFLLVLIISCQKATLYHGLSEEDANEILVVLQESGIAANKEKEVRQNEVFWAIALAQKDLPHARALLVAKNLPRQKELGLSGVYKEKGLIPTPDEQKARFLLALKGEIINSLERLPEVIDADIVLNVPIKEEFGRDERKRPTASVVIKAMLPPDGRSALSEFKVQEFVANSVEGMASRDVSVLISYISAIGQPMRPGETKILADLGSPKQPPSTGAATPMSELMGLKLDEASKDRLKIYLIVFFGLLTLLSLGLIITIVQASRFRREVTTLRAGGAIEGEVAGEGPPRLKQG